MRGFFVSVGVVALFLVAGCAGRPAAGPVRPAPTSPAPDVTAPDVTAPEVTAPGAAASASSVATPTGAGDGPPNYADNNGWKQRHELTAAEKTEGEQLADRIRPALADLRAAQDFAPESTRQALLGLGISPDRMGVTAMRQPSWMDSVPPGAVFEVHFGAAGCVTGDVRPERLLVEVRGAAAEFGCLEPYTH
jgi:hypothetical protein